MASCHARARFSIPLAIRELGYSRFVFDDDGTVNEVLHNLDATFSRSISFSLNAPWHFRFRKPHEPLRMLTFSVVLQQKGVVNEGCKLSCLWEFSLFY